MRRCGCRSAAVLLCCIVASACDEIGTRIVDYVPRTSLIVFSPLYASFGGEHAYSITPYVPTDADAEPLYLSSMRWVVDPSYVSSEPFPSIDGAIKLTTKRTGSTRVSLYVTARDGTKMFAASNLTITAAEDEAWRTGDERYHSGPSKPLPHAFSEAEQTAPAPCGLTPEAIAMLPDNGACSSCHSSEGAPFATVPTPTQIAGYSDLQMMAKPREVALARFHHG